MPLEPALSPEGSALGIFKFFIFEQGVPVSSCTRPHAFCIRYVHIIICIKYIICPDKRNFLNNKGSFLIDKYVQGHSAPLFPPRSSGRHISDRISLAVALNHAYVNGLHTCVTWDFFFVDATIFCNFRLTLFQMSLLSAKTCPNVSNI